MFFLHQEYDIYPPPPRQSSVVSYFNKLEGDQIIKLPRLSDLLNILHIPNSVSHIFHKPKIKFLFYLLSICTINSTKFY